MGKIGIILEFLLDVSKDVSGKKEHFLDTPYGKPSGTILTGKLMDREVAIIFRNGNKGEIPDFLVNNKANIFALHDMGCGNILASSVCGSLREEIMTGEFVIFDQFIDLTTHRELTFSDKLPLAKLNHSAFDKPFSEDIRNSLIEAAVVKGFTVHTKGTVLAVDGPRQSTRAESNLYRKWGADVVNTATAPEAILAYELGIGYGVVSLCTYYDTWRTDILPATRAEKQEVIDQCTGRMHELLVEAVEKMA